MAFKFEKLEVWKRALELSRRIHEITLKFPKAEAFILVPQIQRAADSIVLNIAEGCTGQTNPEFRQFLGYAIRSTVEVAGCLYLAQSRGIITSNDFEPLYNETEEIVKMLQSLRKSIG